jgi:Flp pilus assembly protein TadD
MANAFRALPIVGRVPSKEAFPQARAAARQALEIDDGLVDAHVALGWIRFSFDWDWIAAEEELQRAISLSPENPDAHRAYGHLLSNLGRHDEALAEIRLVRELDPLMLIGNALEGQFLFYAGRNREAEVRFRKTLDLEPNYWVAHNGLGRVYLLRKMFSEAAAAFTTARALAPESLEPIPQLGYALARWGKRDEARAILRELESRAAVHYVPAYNFAMIHNGLGEREQALHYLEQSFEQREVQLTFIRIDTRWDDLRADPRFVSIARRVGLE